MFILRSSAEVQANHQFLVGCFLLVSFNVNIFQYLILSIRCC